jgi:hypothetical protein
LIAFIDDHSRLVPYARFYLSETIAVLFDAFEKAMLKRGLPRKLYVDNGAVPIVRGTLSMSRIAWHRPGACKTLSSRKAKVKSSVSIAGYASSFCLTIMAALSLRCAK